MKNPNIDLGVAEPGRRLNFSPRHHERLALAPAQLRTGNWKWPVLAALLLAPVLVFGQSYFIDWHKVAGGGGTSSNGAYSVRGTIGQHDAGGRMTGRSYSLTGGFWSVINIVQTPGVPNLIIVPNGVNSVKVIWPDPATNTYTLQQNANLATTSWVTTGYTITNGFGTNFCIITPPAGNLFFRLANP